MELRKLKIGTDYFFTHKRKGRFRATLKSIEPAAAGDGQDSVILTVAIDTSANGRPDLARTRGASVTVAGIRPSLLLAVDEITYEPPQTQVQDTVKRSLFDRLFKRR